MAPVKHGHARWKNNSSPEYLAWAAMLARCRNPNNKRYARYGGRGITVCERWEDFRLFISDMGPRPTDRHSLDRIDNDGPYKPENCRWATAKEQARTCYRARRISGFGTDKLLTEWAKEYGIGHKVIARRLAAGMTLEEAVTAPVDKKRWETRRQRQHNGMHRLITAFGKTMTLSAWSQETGIPKSAIAYRIDKGWNVNRALSTQVMVSGEWQRTQKRASK